MNDATIEGERRQRLWEKQAAAYEDVVKEMLLRRTQRELALSRGDIGTGPPALERIRRRGDEPESIRIKALLLAYGSPAVQTAFEASEQVTKQIARAASDLLAANDRLTEAAQLKQSGTSIAHPEPLPDYEEVLRSFHALKNHAFAVDQQLFDAINRELAWSPRRGTAQRHWWPRRVLGIHEH